MSARNHLAFRRFRRPTSRCAAGSQDNDLQDVQRASVVVGPLACVGVQHRVTPLLSGVCCSLLGGHISAWLSCLTKFLGVLYVRAGGIEI